MNEDRHMQSQPAKERKLWPLAFGALGGAAVAGFVALAGTAEATRVVDDLLIRQTEQSAANKSAGCLDCHTGIEPMHASETVVLGCTDCHGGDSAVRADSTDHESEEFLAAKKAAHVQPRHPEYWSENGSRTARNPERTYTQLNEESPEFIRFINPGDLRVAEQACGTCHPSETARVPRSTMATSSIFWAAAAYANGIIGQKFAILGEHYLPDGRAALLRTGEENIPAGTVPLLLPLPRWETTQPGEYFRAFERGGILNANLPPEIGNPNPLEEPGRPDIRSSNRGRGTGLRISPALINLQKTRLNDPHLSFLGTNDHPGDYRSSGCSACHVVYANDRDPVHSGPWAEAGHTGRSMTDDPMIPKSEKGHPIRHRLTRAIPTSQCMSCHMHQPNSFVNTYLGYTMWDYEADAAHFFPEEQRRPTAEERRTSLDHNPEGAAVRGLWTDRDFLEQSSELNPGLEHTQIADYHGHGWLFQAVYKRDRKGRLLDGEGNVVDFSDPEKFRKAVHLKDIHLEKGMHCSDCHFDVDSHGTGSLHGEFAATVEIDCRDCHGTVDGYATLRTSGPAAPPRGTDLSLATTTFGKRRFAWREGTLYQRSMVTPELEWRVPQVRDTITPGNPDYNEKSAYAKTIRKDGATWGDLPSDHPDLAHRDQEMTCYSCHSAWVTNCFGCHLPQEANEKSKMIRYEGATTRNYASYNPQVVRWDAYMLGIEGNVRDHRVSPVRSSSALVLSSTNLNRERIYTQQPTISAPGYNGQAMNTHVPHTVRSTETKGCTDCHVSGENDNNAWMAQLLLQGTNFVNFMGRYVWVGEGNGGVEAIAVTEWDEPQAVIGSTLQRIVYPDDWKRHQDQHLELQLAHHHHGHHLESLQLRGEYLYTAQGEEGMIVYDVANIDNKGFSERITSAPVSPVGQKSQVVTADAAAIALPTNNPMAPHRKMLPVNQEQPIHPIYHYAMIADREEGLILVNVDTLTDGDPENNFLERALTFNPGGRLDGAEAITIAGNHVLVLADDGLIVIDASVPLQPRIVATLDEIHHGTSVQVQFRYAFVTDREGLAVVDVTDWSRPRVAARVPIETANRVYVARTYAYVAAGEEGMVIVDVEKPDRPFIDQTWTGGVLRDTHDIKVASTNASLYAYVADGENGLFVLQMISPDTVPEYAGFSPRPSPRVIARRHTHQPALAISKPLDRDRGADESGNQVTVFNRIGARPMNLDEMRRLFMRDGRLYTVTDEPEAQNGSGGVE